MIESTRYIVIFKNNDGVEFVLTDKGFHEFVRLTDETLQLAQIFPDRGYAKSYPHEMIRRGVWNDTGIYCHKWQLHDGDQTISRIYSTYEFVEYLKTKAQWKDNPIINEVFVGPDDIGFLDSSRYTIRKISITMDE